MLVFIKYFTYQAEKDLNGLNFDLILLQLSYPEETVNKIQE